MNVSVDHVAPSLVAKTWLTGLSVIVSPGIQEHFVIRTFKSVLAVHVKMVQPAKISQIGMSASVLMGLKGLIVRQTLMSVAVHLVSMADVLMLLTATNVIVWLGLKVLIVKQTSMSVLAILVRMGQPVLTRSMDLCVHVPKVSPGHYVTLTLMSAAAAPARMVHHAQI